MAATSRIEYARSGDVHIAYHLVGNGPLDVVFVDGWVTNRQVYWEEPWYRRFCERIGSFARVILFDKRGMGLSDRVEAGTLEERMDDVRAVMDAVGSERAALVGESEGGPMSILFAATYPQRTLALLLCGAEVKEERTPDWPWGEATRAEFEERMRSLWARWGRGGERFAESRIPSRLGDRRLGEWADRLMMQSASPGAAETFMRMAFEIDVRHVVATVRVPTLVIHAVDDAVCHPENGRFLAQTIPNARLLELPGGDHVPWGEHTDEVVAEIQEFLTGVRDADDPDRVLATVLFTDLVASTERLRALGDRGWRDLLEAHHAVTREQLARFGGREIDTAGDGFFAAFDGPARAIRCARAIVARVGELGLGVRAGVHTGECEVLGNKLAGLAVHIGARVAAHAAPGEVLISSTVRDLIAGSNITLEDRGLYSLKGIDGERRLFAAT
ncbi:MAG: adenylate/guanylate cyclase domain-containing protein [Actinobacteria bacterium]|nr:adenylate/guanylate cyclase domain-containing protein [Actinomycetota bacterium]